MKRSVLFLWIGLLLIGQHAAHAHALTHRLAQTQNEQSLPHSQVCDQCLAHAALGAAAPCSAPIFADADVPHRAVAPVDVAFRALAVRAFFSRAPPVLA